MQHAEVEVSPGTPPVASGCILLVVSPSAWLLVGLLSVVTMDWEYGLMGRPPMVPLVWNEYHYHGPSQGHWQGSCSLCFSPVGQPTAPAGSMPQWPSLGSFWHRLGTTSGSPCRSLWLFLVKLFTVPMGEGALVVLSRLFWNLRCQHKPCRAIGWSHRAWFCR